MAVIGQNGGIEKSLINSALVAAATATRANTNSMGALKMGRLTRVQETRHQEALNILQQDVLSDNQKEFVFQNYHESATNLASTAGAFFTPLALAWEFALYSEQSKRDLHYVDICAGIGVLAYSILTRYPDVSMTCLEINPDYVKIGKKLVPQANWVQMDVMDLDELRRLGRFDMAVSNPPFGAVNTFSKKRPPRYTGSESEYKVIDVAALIADSGAFIVPQDSAGFKNSGVQNFQEHKTEKFKKFALQTGIELEAGFYMDTTSGDIDKGWKMNIAPKVEFVTVEKFAPYDERQTSFNF